MLRENVIKFLKSLTANEREKLKLMLDHNIVCCSGYAKDLKLDVEEFNAELRRAYR